MKRRPYLELHVTFRDIPEYRDIQEMVVKAAGWTYSRIDTDPILGKGVKSYATKHLNSRKFSEEDCIKEVSAMGDRLRLEQYEVLREKVELVLHDEIFK